jgi:outer membrane immunogenic protein
MRYLVLAALAASAAATPAFAQNENPFTGPHGSVIAGYDVVKEGEADIDNNSDGFLYGLNLGYDFQLGGAVAGIEAEVSDSTTKARGTDLLLTGDSLRLDTDRDLYIGARVGAAVGPTTLLYAKGGYTNARFKLAYNDGTNPVLRQGVTLDGYRLGAGVEQKFNLFGPAGFIKGEYRYSNYKNLDYAGADIDTDVDRHQFLVGVGVRF